MSFFLVARITDKLAYLNRLHIYLFDAISGEFLRVLISPYMCV